MTQVHIPGVHSHLALIAMSYTAVVARAAGGISQWYVALLSYPSDMPCLKKFRPATRNGRGGLILIRLTPSGRSTATTTIRGCARVRHIVPPIWRGQQRTSCSRYPCPPVRLPDTPPGTCFNAITYRVATKYAGYPCGRIPPRHKRNQHDRSASSPQSWPPNN